MTTRTPRSRPSGRGAARTAAARAVVATTALLVAAAVGGLAAGPAAAETPAPDPSASPSASAGEDYTPHQPPSIDVTVLQPVCDGDVPYLQYAVVPTGTPNDTVTITWENPTGADVVMADLPLTGRVLWPGAKVDADGKPVDWPGWRLENGTWVEGDEFDWVRPSVDVKFKVNPEATATVSYPPSTPTCNTNPPGKPDPAIKVDGLRGTLPVTGAETLTLAGVAAGLLALGTVALVLARRRAL